MPRFDFCRLNLYSDENIATIYRDDKIVAFMDANPAVEEGHVLVLPIRHYSLLTQMPVEEFSHLMLISHRIAVALKQAYQTDSIKVDIFDGEKTGGTVDHVHVHLIPRYDGDGFIPAAQPVYWKRYSERHGSEKGPPIEELRKVVQKIKSYLA